jgi:hypothetical protein
MVVISLSPFSIGVAREPRWCGCCCAAKLIVAVMLRAWAAETAGGVVSVCEVFEAEV